ncbi:MAG: TonB-dependent receptor [Bacteroidales bacterium]
MNKITESGLGRSEQKADFRIRSGPFSLKKGFFLFFLLSLSGFRLLAQSGYIHTIDTVHLPMVTVSSSGLNQSESHFSQQFDTISMQSMQSSELANLLSQHSAVFVKSYGPGALASVSLRGTAANHTLVLWNDIPINAPMLGQVDFSQIPVFFIDQAGVQWGAAATEKRPGGLGGTVSLANNVDLNNGFKAEFSQSVGSYSTFGSYGDVSYSRKNFQMRTRFFSKSSRNDFEYENTAVLPARRMRQEDAAYADKGVMQEFHFVEKFGTFSLISWNQWNARDLPPIMTNLERGGNPEEYQNDRFHRNLISYRKSWSKLSIETKAAWFIEYQNYYLRTTSSAPDAATVTLIDSKNKLESVYGQTKLSARLSDNLLLTGRLQWTNDRVNSNNYDDIKSRNLCSWVLGSQWDVLPGLRSDWVLRQDFDGNTNLGLFPAVSFQYKLPVKQNVTLATGVNRNYHLPGMNDLYWYPGGNEQLKAEKAVTADLSIDWQTVSRGIAFDSRLNFFVSKIDDWIQWRPTNYRFWEPLNIAAVLARGMDLSLNAETQLASTKLGIRTNYVLTLTTDESQVARIENTSGKQLIYIPRHHANAFFYAAYQKYQLTYTLEYTGKRSTSLNGENLYTGVLPAYLLHHISVSRQFKWLGVEARINNLLNKSYQAVLWRAMPGINANLLLHVQL